MVSPNRAKHRIPISVIAIYCIVILVFIGVGIWLANDLVKSRSSIIAERSALAVQTSKFMSNSLERPSCPPIMCSAMLPPR